MEQTKKFGFWTLTFLVVANMIGAGVFTTSGFAIGDLGSPKLVVLAWLAGGVVAIGGAVGYGQLIRAMPESGGEYLFLARAVHPMVGFVAGWVSITAGFSGAIAFAALAFESYLGPMLGVSLQPNVLAIGAILGAGVFHGAKPGAGAIAQNIVVMTKLVLLALILIIAGFTWLGVLQLGGNAWQEAAVPFKVLRGWELVRVFATSLVWISLSYAGFNAAVYVAGEVEHAEKTVPRALLSGTLIVSVLYLLLNAVFVYAPLPQSIQFQEDVAAIAAQALGGNGFENFVRVTISVCLLTSVFSMMMAAPRVYAKMADDRLLPNVLRFQGESPVFATIFQMVLAVTLVYFSSLKGLLSYLSLTLSLSSACSVACIFLPKLRKRALLSTEVDVARARFWLPMIYVVSTLISAGIMATIRPKELFAAVLTFVFGGVIYYFTKSDEMGNG